MHRLVLFLLSLFSISTIAAPQESLQEFKLDNGLKILVKEDHRAPVAVMMVAYHVGSADEPGGLTGISHMLEHMMFKGTPKYAVGKFSQIIADKGGEQNAFTSADLTLYFEKIAADQLPIAFDLESDRMQNLTLDAKEFTKEHQVVIEEWRMRSVDPPVNYARERFLAAAHLSLPYQHPTIGWADDLKNYTIDDVKHWYQTYYAPNNAVIVVAGDVKAADIFKLAKQYFGGIPSRVLPVRKPQLALEVPGLRDTLVQRQAKVPQLFIGFNTPSRMTSTHIEETYALNVAASILAGGDSSRLPKELVRKDQIAVQIGADYDLYSRFDGLFTISATPSVKSNPKDLRDAIVKQLELLQTKPVDPKELDRIKLQVIAEHTYQRDSVFGQGMEIAMMENLGLGWKEIEDYTNAIQAVTPEQIQAVAKQYLIPQRMTVTVLEPQASPEGTH